MKKIISNIISKYDQLTNTYYDEDNYNISVFWVLLKLEKEKLQNMWISESIKVVGKRLSILMWYINFLRDRYIERLSFTDATINSLKKYARKWDKKYLRLEYLSQEERQKAVEAVFTIWPLTEIIDQIMMIKYGYINELEKLFKEKIWDKKERMIRQEQIQKFDVNYHFWYILDKKTFSYRSLLYFYSCLKKENFNYLQDEEKDFLKKLFRKILKKHGIEKNKIKKDYEKIEKISHNKVLDKKLDIKDAIELFKEFISISGLEIEVSDSPDYSNFAANFSQLKVPTWNSFSHISIYEFLILCAHEIETHNYCFHNTLKLTWEKITLPFNNIRDEWLAKANELLLFKRFKSKIEPNHNLLRLFIWKEIRWKNYLYFLKVLEKIDLNAKWLNKRFLRYKKFYSFDLQWTFSKDICYDTWTNWAKKYLDKLKKERSIIPYLSLELLRVWHNSLDLSEIYLTNILEKNNIDTKNNKEVIKFFKKQWYVFRWFYSDYILYNLVNKKYVEEEFLKTMKKDYYFLPSDCIKYFSDFIDKEKLNKIIKMIKEKSKN